MQPPMFRLLSRGAEQAAGFKLMQQLRPHLSDLESFTRQLDRQAYQGYRLWGLWQGDQLAGLIGFRELENLIYGRFIYVDDLIVDPTMRQSGLGSVLLDKVREEARLRGCAHLVLDTGLHMALAQRFYFRAGLLARGMHFVQPLDAAQESAHA
ncbi:GCN5 family acetyltransferase [Pseudomonas syringae]|uniref:GCN5 family acetyltransferase n=1 Tax=Pseudomonas syringae TaxID=317 RepID=A0A1C7Z6S4_PSESX|nr:GNAT family N-acetyltransferase [Pseudomonas syringae]OCR25641.1 GCN5 family acetyltransferase [Pseudomonas syringae]